MNDSSTTLNELKQLMAEFVSERDWGQFHSPKNLSMSLAIESAEVMEHFQWLTINESRNLDESQKSEVADELADVFCYLLAISKSMQIDLSSAVKSKMEKNRRKYPAEEFRGRL